MDKEAFYFPHFCGARHDRKIKRLRKELGTEGYGIFFMLLEILREQLDFKYPMEDIDLLAEEFGTSEQKVRVVICNYKLFEIHEDEFFSPKLLVYMQPYLRAKAQRKLAGQKSGEVRRIKALNETQSNDRSTDAQLVLNENEQRKVKESKVNTKPLSDTQENLTAYEELFDELWKLYPRKEGRSRVKKAKKIELYRIGLEEMTRAIERYKKAKKGKEYEYLQMGSTFFNSGYIDYLDKEYENMKPVEEDRYRSI